MPFYMIISFTHIDFNNHGSISIILTKHRIENFIWNQNMVSNKSTGSKSTLSLWNCNGMNLIFILVALNHFNDILIKLGPVFQPSIFYIHVYVFVHCRLKRRRGLKTNYVVLLNQLLKMPINNWTSTKMKMLPSKFFNQKMEAVIQ